MCASDDVLAGIRNLASAVFHLKSHEVSQTRKSGSFPSIVSDEGYRRLFRVACERAILLAETITIDVDLKSPFSKYGLSCSVENGGPSAYIDKSGNISSSILFLYKNYITNYLFQLDALQPISLNFRINDSEILCASLDSDQDTLRHSISLCLFDAMHATSGDSSPIFNSTIKLFSSIYFTVCHEIAHFVSGHFAVVSKADSEYSIYQRDQEKFLNDHIDESIRSWAREFSSDMYGIHRCMLAARILAHALKNERAYVEMLCGGIAVIANLSRGLFDVYKTHPSAFSRFIASLSATLNSISPVNNASSGFRPSYIPWPIEYDKHGYALLGSEAWVVLSLTYDRSIIGLSLLNNSDLVDHLGIDEKRSIIACAGLWRIGYGLDLGDADLISGNNNFSNVLRRSIAEFSSGMVDLCLDFNMKYAMGFPKGLIGMVRFADCAEYCRQILKCEGRDFLRESSSGVDVAQIIEEAFLRQYVVDPAYQSLDAIFSNIYSAVNGERAEGLGLSKQEEIDSMKRIADIAIEVAEEAREKGWR